MNKFRAQEIVNTLFTAVENLDNVIGLIIDDETDEMFDFVHPVFNKIFGEDHALSEVVGKLRDAEMALREKIDEDDRPEENVFALTVLYGLMVNDVTVFSSREKLRRYVIATYGEQGKDYMSDMPISEYQHKWGSADIEITVEYVKVDN